MQRIVTKGKKRSGQPVEKIREDLFGRPPGAAGDHWTWT